MFAFTLYGGPFDVSFIPMVGATVVVVGFGLPFLHVILQLPPLEPFFPSVTTLMAKFPLTLAVSFPFLPQSLR